MVDQCFHLTVTADVGDVIHGWWAVRAVADLKFRSWIGEHGSIPGARVVLVDEATGTVLADWPEKT